MNVLFIYQVDQALRLDHLYRQRHPSHFVRQFLVDLSKKTKYHV